MKYDAFREACFSEALAKGCDAAEIYYQKNDSFSVNVLEGEVESYEVNTSGGANLRVILEGKSGYAFTEKLDEPEKLVLRAMDNARSIEITDEQPMQGRCEYQRIERAKKRADELSTEEKTELAMEMESKAKALDERVVRMMDCSVVTEKSNKRISNTLGLDAQDESTLTASFIAPVTQVGNDVRNGSSFRFGDEIFDIEATAREAVEESVMQHGGAPVPTGKYRVLIQKRAMTALLAAFSPMFSAEAAQKGLTLFADKLGSRIASENITIVDDPFYKGNERPFDDEGVPSVKTAVVERGVLKSFLHDLKTAKKAGVASTSNGGRADAASPVGVMPSNLIITAGLKSFDELVEMLSDGLIITEMSGMHAGLSTVSGEFSLIARGLLVEHGRVVRPVEQVTAGGTFMGLIADVLAIGGDVHRAQRGASCFAAPSILVGELTIAGE